MDKILAAIGIFSVAIVFIFIGPIVGVLIGAFSGWIVSLLAPVWVPTGLALIGLHVTAAQLVEVGAALGFLGGFFRVARPSNSGKES